MSLVALSVFKVQERSLQLGVFTWGTTSAKFYSVGIQVCEALLRVLSRLIYAEVS